jgi:heat shock protein HslJ
LTQPAAAPAKESPVDVAVSAVASEAASTAIPAPAGQPASPSEGLQAPKRPLLPRLSNDPWDKLWGQSFASVRMTDGGKVRRHALGVRVLLHFWQADGQDRIRSAAGCYGALTSTLKRTATRFWLTGKDAHVTGCRWGEVIGQTEWVGRVLRAGPRWHLLPTGDLVLRSGTKTITFEPHPWGPPWPMDTPPGIDLWDRSFASVEITRDGVTQAPADGARLLLNPYRHEGQGQLRTNGGCNTGGTSLRITAERFLVGDDGYASAALCEPEERMEQEYWFRRFLETDPQWSVSPAGLLVLRNARATITFEEHHWPPPWRADGHP